MKDHSEWCRRIYDRLQDGGVWGVPRTGLLFKKDEANNRMVLVAHVPPETMSVFLQIRREADFKSTKKYFAEVGIKVEKADDIRRCDTMDDAVTLFAPRGSKKWAGV